MVPADGPEPARLLTRGGAENLVALAELGAAVRWMHPSDQAVATQWEPLWLDGIRGLEGATTRLELVEGLRGLLAEVAPTVVIWRGHADEGEGDDEALDEPACPDPEAEDTETETEPETETETETKDGEAPEPDASENRARPPADKLEGGLNSDRPGPPARTRRGAPSDRKLAEQAAADAAAGTEDDPDEDDEHEPRDDEDQPDDSDDDEPDYDEPDDDEPDYDEPDDDEPDDDEPDDDEPDDDEPDDDEPDDDEPDDDEPDDSDGEDEDKPGENGDDADDTVPEDRPPLPDALLATGDELEITQWWRRGFDEGPEGETGCARRLRVTPGAELVCSAASTRRERRASPCSRCEGQADDHPRGPEHDPSLGRPAALTPGAPAILTLTRGLASMVPTALWTRAGRTLPEAATPSEPAPTFDERGAWDYTLADRGTRLLAVVRAWSLLRRFHAHRERVADPRASLVDAMCAVADDESPARTHAALETLLAAFGDGNAEILIDTGRAARRYAPPVALRWLGERVVVVRSPSALLIPGDVVTAIDGLAIDELLARELRQTPAATASAAIDRCVARLLARRERGASVELDAMREAPADSTTGASPVAVALSASENIEALTADARPSKAMTPLAEDIWYLDATRVARLDAAARRLREAAAVIVDLRGRLASAHGSLLAHFIDAPLTIANERIPSGPNADAELELDALGERRVEPRGPRCSARVVVLADSRTRARAELELAGFDQLGATIVGSASAGDLGAVSQAWLPGGWRMRFTITEVRRSDGSRLWGHGVRPSVPVEPSRLGVEGGEDELLAAALAELESS